MRFAEVKEERQRRGGHVAKRSGTPLTDRGGSPIYQAGAAELALPVRRRSAPSGGAESHTQWANVGVLYSQALLANPHLA